MATKAKSDKGTWNGFYSYYLSEEERAGIRILLDGKKPPSIENCINELVLNNYKLSITFNEANSTFICSATGKAGSLNRGYTYSLNHVELTTAIVAVWFVVGEILQWGEWDVESDKAPDW